MTAITIRKLPESLKQRLRMRAAENGRSMEAEARDILVSALAPPQVDFSWREELTADFGAIGDAWDADWLDLPARDEAPRQVDFARRA
jgi:plasmid stability protein